MDELAQPRSSGRWHAAMFYRDADEFAAGVASFVDLGARTRDPVLVVSPGPNLDRLRTRLDGQGERVTWADMSSIGLNPARLIDRIRRFADEHRGRAVWCVQEPAWPDRSPQELREVIRHEALLNLALADGPVSVLCPYGLRLSPETVTGVQRTHPVVARAGRCQPSASYAANAPLPEECDRPLSSAPEDAEVLTYQADPATVRDFAAVRARRAGLSPRRAGDLVIAVGELAANTLAHTSGPGTAMLWVTDREVICQVHDLGQIADPLAGRLRPDPVAASGGLGLWVVQQLCDLVETRTGPDGTTTRLHMRLSSLSPVLTPPPPWCVTGTAGRIRIGACWLDGTEPARAIRGRPPGAHRPVLRRRRAWFEPMTQAYTALWRIRRGTTPAIAEAEDTVRFLRAHGPTPHAFTLRVHFPPPGDASGGARAGRAEWMCPA